MGQWIEVEQARGMSGMRLVLTAGVPGPWGEAAKGIFYAKGIPYVRVRQDAGRDNDALFAWTGQRNAPLAMYDDEPGRSGWVEILWLAERLAPQPSLIPADPDARVRMFGLANELLGENGLGWCRRLMLFHGLMGDAEEPQPALRAMVSRMLRQYGYRREAALAAPARVAEILRLLSEQLRTQRAAGHAYLMGASLTALDIYWAAMGALIDPLPPALCPMPESLRHGYTVSHPDIVEVLDPALLEHRDMIYERHLELPIEL